MSSLPIDDAPLRLVVRHHEGVPVLVVPDALPFDRLREWMRSRVPDVLPELGGRGCRLDLGGRELQLFDVRRLLHLLRDEFQVEVTGLYVTADAVHRYAERELKLRLFVEAEPVAAAALPTAPAEAPADALPGLDALAAFLAEESGEPETTPTDPGDEPPPATLAASDDALPPRRPIPVPSLTDLDPEPAVDAMGGKRVLTLHRTLRSGAAVHYDGDVHVFGDVNAGAHVRAGGSVVVFGRLRGTVHAGAHGDAEATVVAFDMAPTQIRIGKHIALAPERGGAEAWVPEIAHVHDGAIVLEAFSAGRGRLSAAGRRSP